MRLIVVSNRLPVTLKRQDNNIIFKSSPGGVATGLLSYLESLNIEDLGISDYLWVGWPGLNLAPEESAALAPELTKQKIYPVLVTPEAEQNYYHGFSNQTIWPLFHSLEEHVVINNDYWESYKQQNEIFADTLLKILKPGDVLWMHDFHLMLLPKLLRDRKVENAVGFFLHIPFPSVDSFGRLPADWIRPILDSLSHANLIGFHIEEYLENFKQVLAAYERRLHGRSFAGWSVIDEFPIGIKFEKFYHAMYNPDTQRERTDLLKHAAGKKIIFSVDRLDYTKGIPQRLRGFRLFLQEYLEWHGKLIYILYIAPSRGEVGDYGKIKAEAETLIRDINSDFATADWQPIEYHYEELPFARLAALYNASNVALITPIKDGMNLVAKEYVAAKSGEPGVLVLSKFAGAAKELTEALIIDPHEEAKVSDAIAQALVMPDEEQIVRNQTMQKTLQANSINYWAKNFLNELITLQYKEKFAEHRAH